MRRANHVASSTSGVITTASLPTSPRADHLTRGRFARMHRSPHSDPARPGRRVVVGGVLAALGVAASGSLAGCAVRWEDSAPQIPLVPIPTREPVPAEDALVWLLTDCRDLAAAQDATPRDESAEDGSADDARSSLYATQAAVLRSALYRAGIPIETLDEALETVPPAPEPAPTAALRRIEDLARCGGGLFPLVMSLLAQRWAAIVTVGETVPDEALAPETFRLWSLPYLAVPFAELTDAAEYGFEVVTAQSHDEQRGAAQVTLERVRALRREQIERSGWRAPSPRIGYPLPFPVSSRESAAQLATHLAAGLIGGHASLLPTMVGTAQEETARDLVAWLGTAAAIGTEWAVPLVAFPGMESVELEPTEPESTESEPTEPEPTDPQTSGAEPTP